MTIKTCITINTTLFRKLIDHIDTSGLSKRQLMSRLVKRIIKRKEHAASMFSRVHYQPRSEDTTYHIVHVTFDPHDYEMCLDFRKVFKMTVSFILANALEHYLDEIIQEASEDSGGDNYCTCYIFTPHFSPGEEYFIIHWTYPTRKTLIHPLHDTASGANP